MSIKFFSYYIFLAKENELTKIKFLLIKAKIKIKKEIKKII